MLSIKTSDTNVNFPYKLALLVYELILQQRCLHKRCRFLFYDFHILFRIDFSTKLIASFPNRLIIIGKDCFWEIVGGLFYLCENWRSYINFLSTVCFTCGVVMCAIFMMIFLLGNNYLGLALINVDSGTTKCMRFLNCCKHISYAAVNDRKEKWLHTTNQQKNWLCI